MSSEHKRRCYFYPLLFVVPGFDPHELSNSAFSISKRKWQTSTFDLATLATRHRLHLPYQLIDVFLSHCNLELRIDDQDSLDSANAAFRAFRVGASSAGLSPFLCPFVATHSINEYSGINSRDSSLLSKDLSPDLQVGITSDTSTVEIWPLEYSLNFIMIPEKMTVTSSLFSKAVSHAEEWHSLLPSYPSLSALESAMIAAPAMGSQAQSLLHIWTALESIFPTVSTEVTFRLALYLAQLTHTEGGRLDCYNRVRAAYNVRSQVAHGSKIGVAHSDWVEAWGLLTDCVSAVIRRRVLPSEKELIAEILS